MTFRSLLLTVIAAFLLTGCAELIDALLEPDPVVYVDNRSYPTVFDPYYNQPKIYRQPRYYESTSKKTKGNKVFKTTTVKDEYGQHRLQKHHLSQEEEKELGRDHEISVSFSSSWWASQTHSHPISTSRS